MFRFHTYFSGSRYILTGKEIFEMPRPRNASKRTGTTATNGETTKTKKAKMESALGPQSWVQFGAETSKGLKPLIYLNKEMNGCDKIACFDMDDTLIRTSSGKKFATSAADWQFWSDNVPSKLKSLSEDGYKLVIFTNQAGIEKKKTTAQELTSKISAIIEKLGLEMQAFVATGENQFRKPSTKMWDFMVEKCNKGVHVDKQKSFYVGDAAGRAKGWASGKPKDFGCSDRKFAANVGIDFFTPEEYFEDQKKAAFDWRSEHPTDLVKQDCNTDYSKLVSSKDRELVLMVGSPASGKSTLTNKYFAPKEYVIVSRDLMKTQEKCLKHATEALKAGKRVVVDNTNPSKEARAAFINIAKKFKFPVRCIWLQTSVKLSHHLNIFRQTLSEGKQRRVPDVGFNVYKSKFEEPSLDEGFSKIEKIEFNGEFESTADEDLFKQWS